MSRAPDIVRAVIVHAVTGAFDLIGAAVTAGALLTAIILLTP